MLNVNFRPFWNVTVVITTDETIYSLTLFDALKIILFIVLVSFFPKYSLELFEVEIYLIRYFIEIPCLANLPYWNSNTNKVRPLPSNQVVFQLIQFFSRYNFAVWHGFIISLKHIHAERHFLKHKSNIAVAIPIFLPTIKINRKFKIFVHSR